MVLRSALSLLFCLCVPTTFVQAKDAAVVRVELLLGQKAELNRLSKSVCYLIAGADPALLTKAAHRSADAVDAAFQTLLVGGGADDLPPEDTPQTRAALDTFREDARGFLASSRQLVAGDLHQVPMLIFLTQGPVLRARVDQLQTEIVPHYLTAASQRSALPAVHLLQSQSARLQGLLRDACLLKVGLMSAEGKSRMREEFERFEAGLSAMREGDPVRRIGPPPDIPSRILIDRITTSWSKIRPTISAALDGAPVEMRALQKASLFGDQVDRSFAKVMAAHWGH